MQRSGHRESKQVKLLQQFGGGCSRENNCTWKNRSPVLGAHIPASIHSVLAIGSLGQLNVNWKIIYDLFALGSLLRQFDAEVKLVHNESRRAT